MALRKHTRTPIHFHVSNYATVVTINVFFLLYSPRCKQHDMSVGVDREVQKGH